MVIIVGSILGILVAVVIVVIIIVLWRKGIIPKERRRKETHRLVTNRETDNDSSAYSNPIIDVEDCINDDINPYGTTVTINSNTVSVDQDASGHPTESVEKGKVGPVTGDVYAAVNKRRPKASSETQQTQNKDVDTTRKKPDIKPFIQPKPKEYGHNDNKSKMSRPG
ncbi:hypothetical protein LSH36_3151g00000, partial [Paralvinella palmiformis]